MTTLTPVDAAGVHSCVKSSCQLSSILLPIPSNELFWVTPHQMWWRRVPRFSQHVSSFQQPLLHTTGTGLPVPVPTTSSLQQPLSLPYNVHTVVCSMHTTGTSNFVMTGWLKLWLPCPNIHHSRSIKFYEERTKNVILTLECFHLSFLVSVILSNESHLSGSRQMFVLSWLYSYLRHMLRCMWHIFCCAEDCGSE